MISCHYENRAMKIIRIIKDARVGFSHILNACKTVYQNVNRCERRVT